MFRKGCLFGLLGLALGIAGLVFGILAAVTGEEIARTAIVLDGDTTLSATANEAGDHELWADLRVEWDGDLELAGDVEIRVGGEPSAPIGFDLRRGKKPMDGQRGSFARMWSSTSTRMKGRIWLLDIDDVPAGALIEVIARLQAGPSTTVEKLEFYLEID